MFYNVIMPLLYCYRDFQLIFPNGTLYEFVSVNFCLQTWFDEIFREIVSEPCVNGFYTCLGECKWILGVSFTHGNVIFTNFFSKFVFTLSGKLPMSRFFSLLLLFLFDATGRLFFCRPITVRWVGYSSKLIGRQIKAGRLTSLSWKLIGRHIEAGALSHW